MPHASRQLAIQSGLIVFCVLFIIFTRSGASVSSQVPDCAVPPHYPGYPPPNMSWPYGSTVTVKIDDTWTNASDRNAFRAGIEKWNGAANCSGVTFVGFQTQHFTDYEAAPPTNTVYWQRKSDLGVRMHYHPGTPLRVRAARVGLLPEFVNQYNNTFFVYLGTHEIGHTFGMTNCVCKQLQLHSWQVNHEWTYIGPGF